MPTSRTIEERWTRYDALMRRGGTLTRAEKAELQQLHTALILAGIVTEGDF